MKFLCTLLLEFCFRCFCIFLQISKFTIHINIHSYFNKFLKTNTWIKNKVILMWDLKNNMLYNMHICLEWCCTISELWYGYNRIFWSSLNAVNILLIYIFSTVQWIRALSVYMLCTHFGTRWSRYARQNFFVYNCSLIFFVNSIFFFSIVQNGLLRMY